MSEHNNKRVTHTDWKTVCMSKPLEIVCEMSLTEQEYKKILLGHLPEVMEDKWFMYVGDDYVLHLHRSWTGSEVFSAVIDISASSEGVYRIQRVVVERDEDIFSISDLEELKSLFKNLVYSFSR